jgi:aryl-alcohol dehydrogenase-like predicted oxidoreductase
VTASVRESLARLQLTYVDLIQCHDIEFTQLDQVGRGCCTGVERCGPRPKAPAKCPWCLSVGGSSACPPQLALPLLPDLLHHWLLLRACWPARPPAHCLPPCPAPQIVNETLPALQRLKEEGLVRHIGITGLPLKVYRYVLDRCDGG